MNNPETPELLRYQLGLRLTDQLEYFKLCSSDLDWAWKMITPDILAFRSQLHTDYKGETTAWNEAYFKAAVEYQIDTTKFMEENKFLTVQSREDLTAIKQEHGNLYGSYRVSNEKDLKNVLISDFYRQEYSPVNPLDTVIYVKSLRMATIDDPATTELITYLAAIGIGQEAARQDGYLGNWSPIAWSKPELSYTSLSRRVGPRKAL